MLIDIVVARGATRYIRHIYSLAVIHVIHLKLQIGRFSFSNREKD